MPTSLALHVVDYHVSPTGSDSNTGLSNGQALASVSTALLKTASGDRVLLKRGHHSLT